MVIQGRNKGGAAGRGGFIQSRPFCGHGRTSSSSFSMLFIPEVICLVLCCWLVRARGDLSVDPETSNQICPTSQNNIQQYDAYNNCEEVDEKNALKRVFLSNNVTCNDGSPAGYYIRKFEGSKRWIVFLEGGWYCYSKESCLSRWSRVQYLMSSEQWPLFKSGFGILSSNTEENPYWWNANHVFVPYCTSDIWSGRRSHSFRGNDFTFMGATIVKQVVKQLLNKGLKNANSLILAGSSAGGVGVMLNLEPIQRLLTRYGSKAKLRGITDSGWFLDQPPFHVNADVLTPIQALKQGFPMWRSQIPHSCRTLYPRELWKCFIGYRIYPTLAAPLFVFQWLFDEVQLKAENIGTPVTKQQWEYIHQMGDILRNSFQNVTSVFAPSCISHAILTRKDWQRIRIDDVSVPEALYCWEHERNKVRNNRLHRSAFNVCAHRLIERCSWPQCNHHCPKLQNPLTGEELNLLELLQSFGLDIEHVASALGIDIHTLNNMGQRELISLLTQQAN